VFIWAEYLRRRRGNATEVACPTGRRSRAIRILGMLEYAAEDLCRFYLGDVRVIPMKNRVRLKDITAAERPTGRANDKGHDVDNGVLRNSRHERFAQGRLEGKSAAEAYALAGYKYNDGNAVTLKGKQRVAARVHELKTAAAEGAIVQEIASRTASRPWSIVVTYGQQSCLQLTSLLIGALDVKGQLMGDVGRSSQ
jgi:hypothetical protein